MAITEIKANKTQIKCIETNIYDIDNKILSQGGRKPTCFEGWCGFPSLAILLRLGQEWWRPEGWVRLVRGLGELGVGRRSGNSSGIGWVLFGSQETENVVVHLVDEEGKKLISGCMAW